ARQIAKTTDKPGLKMLMEAILKSERLMAEDISREAGYMLPQSDNTHELLEDLIDNPPTSEFPMEAAKRLLDIK
ncbi:MAG: 4Fe-4S ferredoxin, partial [Butyrivibrio sp.]|nr:4Fe-4S ferredoxin [Butyrivibrio sp.]